MSIIFTIEKGVPVPPVTTRQGHNIALLKAMQPGDSVYFDAPIAKHAPRFYRVAKRLGIKIMVRKDAAGMRLWRLDDEVKTDAQVILRRVSAAPKNKALFTKAAHDKRQAAKGKVREKVSA